MLDHAAIEADDRLLDDPATGHDELSHLFTAWQRELRAAPATKQAPHPRALLWAALIIATLILFAGCGATPSDASAPEPSFNCEGWRPGFCLNGGWSSSEPVRASMIPPYYPTAFGSTWSTVRGSCDVREVVLEDTAGWAAVDTDHDGCRDDGPVLDVYTGRIVAVEDVEIDHVFARKDAWVNGAWRWSPAQRRIFYSDRTNLLAVEGSVNGSKGDRGPDEWRPEARSGWCAYARIYEATAARWQLEVSPARRAALAEMAATCGIAQPR